MSTPQQYQPGAPVQDSSQGPGFPVGQQSGPPGGAPAPGAQVAGYTSPIPVKKTHLGHSLLSEWTKIRTVRSTMWTLAVMFLLVVGIGLLTAMALGSSDGGTTPVLAGGQFGLLLGQICVITLGVLVISSEYGTGMIRTTLAASSSRGRMLLAKSLVFFFVAFVTTTLASTLTAMIQSSMVGGQQVDPASLPEDRQDSVENGKLIATSDEWLDATVGAGLYVALIGLLALAIGAMLRHSAGAITTMLGVILVPPIAGSIMLGTGLKDTAEALLEYSPMNGLSTLFGTPMLPGDAALSGTGHLGLLAGVTVAALIGAYAMLTSRDV
ncbi:ABC transporter permease [Streptomyces oceani]|uniref:ABC transporter permease n=1 Tax=Streptomyces oceani TaxID=1075402 RepID=A0A1E7KPE8_9ACTN|nr:ABC transporter permease [Streptomyces oceani]OEV05701.1 ABC transporter permease [Streptomyces oceani]